MGYLCNRTYAIEVQYLNLTSPKLCTSPKLYVISHSGATPVFYAAQEGHLECLQYLIEHMDGSLKIVAFEGMTAFLSAAEGGHLHVMNYLLEKQGSEALLSTTNDGATVFHYVASKWPCLSSLECYLEKFKDL